MTSSPATMTCLDETSGRSGGAGCERLDDVPVVVNGAFDPAGDRCIEVARHVLAGRAEVPTQPIVVAHPVDEAGKAIVELLDRLRTLGRLAGRAVDHGDLTVDGAELRDL